ncbi:MAG: hypothetical protein QF385_10570, partial [SAR324 cluster bacterium]|nr:hypothetical protein [SAR324 cluster bacterium]
CWVHLFLIDSCVDYPTNAVQIVSFVAEHFKELGSSPILSPHSHVILHVGLARSCRIQISKSEGTPFKELDSFYKLSTNPQ